MRDHVTAQRRQNAPRKSDRRPRISRATPAELPESSRKIIGLDVRVFFSNEIRKRAAFLRESNTRIAVFSIRRNTSRPLNLLYAWRDG